MVIKTFVAKVSRIVNNKEKNYVVYRMNIPSNVTDDLELSGEDYLLVKAQKAQWYHLLKWTGGRMKKTWAKLPEQIRRDVWQSGLLEEEVPPMLVRATSNQALKLSHLEGFISAYLTTVAAASPELTNGKREPALSVSVASRR